jgi:hypothetical protein
VQLERHPESHIIPPSFVSYRGTKEASLAQEVHHQDGHIDNVCLTGGAIIGAFLAGIGLTAVIMWWALFAHHAVGG